jgi:predicted amidohydrolase
MPRTIKVAAVQMDANPTPVPDRLARADRLITQAAQAGTQLVILPELFNTGYAYADSNYQLAEPLNGLTADWLKKSAERLGIHLAGSMLLLDQGEIYDSMLLFSPIGRRWRYDKNYPWAWERGYFRGRHNATIAHTDLGDLGMLICWDTGHRNLWQQYAGQIDLMIVSSCPPDGTNPTYKFPNGAQLTFDDFGLAVAHLKNSGRLVFGQMVDTQTAWLRVPTINAGASGHVQTAVPRSKLLLSSFCLLSPKLLRHLRQANQLQMACDMIPSSKIVDANGQVLAERAPIEGEGLILTEVTLPETKSTPHGPQPKSPLPRLAYFNADQMIPLLMRSVYRQGLRKVGSIGLSGKGLPTD